MSRARLVFVVVASGAIAVSVSAQQPLLTPSPGDETTITAVRAASRALDSALARGDTATLRDFYANEYVHIDQFGARSTKAQRLAELGSGRRRVQAIGAVSDETFSVIGDVVVASAITNGRQTVDGQPTGGGPRMSTRVWVRMRGRWQVALAQVTPIQVR